MPIYEYKCVSCFLVTDGWNKVADRHDCPRCKCGCLTKLQISAVRSNPDYEAFQSLGFGHGEKERNSKITAPEYFRSRKHFKDELKARNLAVAPKKQNSDKQRDFVKLKERMKPATADWVK